MKLKEILNEKYVGKQFTFININDGGERSVVKISENEYGYSFISSNGSVIINCKRISA